MPIILKKFETSKKWRYLWGKYVQDVTLSTHCASCLKGVYTTYLDRETSHIYNKALDETEAKAFYICGVSFPYNWNNNFHLAVVYEQGSVVSVERNGIIIELENARELPIVFDYDTCSHPNKERKAFGTCRNWQFAYLYKGLFE